MSAHRTILPGPRSVRTVGGLGSSGLAPAKASLDMQGSARLAPIKFPERRAGVGDVPGIANDTASALAPFLKTMTAAVESIKRRGEDGRQLQPGSLGYLR